MTGGGQRRHQLAAGMILGAAVVGILVLLLFTDHGPSEAFLACDREGGDWQPESRHCARSDSPLVGAPL